MANADDPTLQAALASSQDDSVAFLERPQQRPGIDAIRYVSGRHRWRGEPRIGEQAHIEVGQTFAGELRQTLVPVKQLLESFVTHHPQGGLQAEEQAQRWGPRRPAIFFG